MALILARHWWTLAIRGLLAILFGIVAFAWPGVTLSILILLFGVYSLTDGLFAVGAAITAHREIRRWMSLLLEGMVGVGIGLITFFWPGITTLALLWLIGLWAILKGILEIGTAIEMRREITGEWLLILGGAISILFGIWLIASPVTGALAVVWLIGGYAFIFGLVMLVLALRLRSIRHWVCAQRMQVS
jgi:uncharacterized membrane protein HdeD (DUF308 family)